jgi:LPXTG-site transpeptidase (sortase) family protein
MRHIVSTVLFVIGILVLIYSLLLLTQKFDPRILSFTGVHSRIVENRKRALPYPEMLTIASAGISLPIVPVEVTNSGWETTEKGIGYLTSSPLPGQKGNSVLYGHNWSNILGNLYKTRIGDTISVSYPNGKTVSFTVAYISIVSPDQIHTIGQTSDIRITVYTCAGFFDEKRLVVSAFVKKNPVLSAKFSPTSFLRNTVDH